MSMTPNNEIKLKWGGWGVVAGAVGAMIVGFNWGGWTTQSKTTQMTDAAVLNARAAICIAQFTKGPNDQKRLAELKAINTWERSAFIEKGGWDKMPGEEKANDTVARACADGLDALLQKS
jgi:hypothetical protein